MTKSEIDVRKLERFFIGEYSEQDEDYVDNIICDDTKKELLRNFLSKQFYRLQPEGNSDNRNLDHILYRIHYDINTKLSGSKSRFIDGFVKWSFRIAGILIIPIIVVVGIHIFKDTISDESAWVEIKAPAWTRAQFRLPDGTIGWLNSNSSIGYYDNLSYNRKVTLKGEAYFDVYKDKGSPFIVSTNDVSLTVLGTQFNVSSYDNDDIVEIALEEGRLLFQTGDMNNPVELRPNELLSYNRTFKSISSENVELYKYLSWTHGKLVFRNDPIDVIARRLERWYNVKVDISGDMDDEINWRATFIDEDIEVVLELMKRSLPIDYRIETGSLYPDSVYYKKRVIITHREN